MLNEPCFEIDSSSEVIPQKQDVQLRMRRKEKKVLTPQVANDLVDKNFDFQSDSSDLMSLEGDLNVDLSSEAKPSKKNVVVKLKKKPKNPLSATNIPDVSHASALNSEAGESSESGLLFDKQSFEFLSSSSVAKRRIGKQSSSAALDNPVIQEREITLDSSSAGSFDLTSLKDPETRKVVIAHLAAMSLAGYTTFYKNQ